MQRDWIDYCSAFGSIATALTLIYLIIKEIITRKHITDLSVIAKELNQQNDLAKLRMKYEVQPKFRKPLVEIKHRVSVTLVNDGQPAVIKEIFVDNTIVQWKHRKPNVIRPNEPFIFYGDIYKKDVYVDELQFGFYVYYEDLYGNVYLLEIACQGETVTNFHIYDGDEIPEEKKYQRPLFQRSFAIAQIKKN